MVTLTQGNVSVTSGVYNNVTSIYCVEDGDLKFTWEDGTSDIVSFKACNEFKVIAHSVEVMSGKFHIGYEYAYN